MVNFTSLEFLFRFLPVFLLAYYLVPSKFRNAVLLLGSLVFYAFGSPMYIFVLAGLTVMNYLFASFSFKSRVGESKKHIRKRKNRNMIIAVAIDLTFLVTFKIIATFINSSVWPLGLSFYIFKMISFQVDVLRGDIELKPKFVDVATYFTMFPQVTQGPIMRYEDGELFNEKKLSFEKAEEGLKYFIIGFAMKVILADRIGILWNDLGMYGYRSISTPLAWLGAIAYSFELYFDFWGYSLMAAGIMVALGFEFIENFNHPYASLTISEFYRRWHMTLGSFFRDYVYFPLGGSRCNKKRMCVNLALVWVLTGLWHGNGLNFLIWGAVLGILIILEKLFYGKFLNEKKIFGHIYVIVLIPLSWVIFAIGNLRDLGAYFGRLFPFVPTTAVVDTKDFVSYLGDYWWMFLLGILLCIPKISELYERFKDTWVVRILLVILFWISIYFSASSAGNPFMYLNF